MAIWCHDPIPGNWWPASFGIQFASFYKTVETTIADCRGSVEETWVGGGGGTSKIRTNTENQPTIQPQ